MNLEANKKNAIAFYKMAYEGNPKKAIEYFIGDEYIQHNPDVADGTQGFINCLFKAASLATLNKRMLSALATHDALSLVITKLNFIWFGSTTVDKCATLENSC